MFSMVKLVKNITWIFGANLIASATKWLILILIARVLTPNEVGMYSLAFSLTAPISIFSNLKLRSLIVTETNIKFYDYLITRILMSVIALIVMVFISATLYLDYFFVIVLVGLNKIFDLHSDLYYSIPQKHSKFNYIGKLMIFKHILQVLFFAIVLYIFNHLLFSLTVLVAVQIMYYYLIEKKLTEKKFSITYEKLNYNNVKKIISLGLPLGLSAMMISLNSNIPRYFLEYFYSHKLLGYFSAIAYLVTIGNLLMNAVAQNFLNKLSGILKKNDVSKFKKYVFGYLTFFSIIFGIVLIIFSYLCGDVFIHLIYGSEYVKYTDILILMSFVLAIEFISWNFDTALMSMRYISVQPKISVIALITSVISGLFLVKNYGVFGATYTLILASFIKLFLRLIFVVYGLKKQY